MSTIRKSKYVRPEIMAPAGDWISLRAAIDAGCDAIYFGVKGMNMRAGAKNFEDSDIKEIVNLCHGKKVKVCLALNTIVYENEIESIKALIGQAAFAGVDAIICWDFAVIHESIKHGVPVYLSTQMSVSNSESILFFYRNMGIRRFVLARECSLEDIVRINENLKSGLGNEAEEIEIEVFVHGAMCVSISGRCFLSQFQFGKSANRGECLQPCRREYLIQDVEDKCDYVIGRNYVLSPEDLCSLPFIEKLMEAGISSFKIEGRNKSPEYVYKVTTAYRKAVDYWFENREQKDFGEKFKALKDELIKGLKEVYNRGFSSGFYLGKPIDSWADSEGTKATRQKQYLGLVINYYKKPGVAEIKVEASEFGLGDEIMFQGKTTGVFSQLVDSIERNNIPIERVYKGELAGLKTEKLVRANDKVYLIKNIEEDTVVS